MIQLPVRRCSACGHTGPTGSFLTRTGRPWEAQPLVCPRCGHQVGEFDPRLA